MSRLCFYVAAAALLSACASGPGGGGRYDPNARETLGTVLERKDTGTTTRQPRSSFWYPSGAWWYPCRRIPATDRCRSMSTRLPSMMDAW